MPLLALATILFFGVGGVVDHRGAGALLQDVLVRGMGHRRQAVADWDRVLMAHPGLGADQHGPAASGACPLRGPAGPARPTAAGPLDGEPVRRGEELFFRGALNTGWASAHPVLFVAIHGYLDPRDRGLLLYGGLLTVFMLGFGWMAEVWGCTPWRRTPCSMRCCWSAWRCNGSVAGMKGPGTEAPQACGYLCNRCTRRPGRSSPCASSSRSRQFAVFWSTSQRKACSSPSPAEGHLLQDVQVVALQPGQCPWSPSTPADAAMRWGGCCRSAIGGPRCWFRRAKVKMPSSG